ncbi:MAG: heme ABC exporter ATP-binding protein CcmA [SAR324 cluster bacterium]|nr:heme ABC exporter ATP-binding protein CcmA [SAR324 cluster bacterium]
MKTPLITLDKVSKRFGYRNVLQNIDLTIYSGESTLLLGNNGAGKTTLLQIICSLMRPSSGSISFKGNNYKEAAHHLRKAIGNISHESRMYGDLTAFENLKLFGNLYSVENLPEQIEKALDFVELSYAKHLPVHTFSSGMTKRLTIARLILYKPEFLILDEPYTGLDQHSVRLFQQYLKQHHQNGGTILNVTHQFPLGLELSNRVLVMHQSQILHDVPASQTSPEQCSLWLQQN